MKIVAIIGIIFASCLISFGFFYLIGSFCNATFDLKQWDKTGRGFIGFSIAVCSAGISAIALAEFIDKPKKES